MGYLNESGLARYDGLVKSWVTYESGTVDGLEPLLNWQKTATAGAVTCYPLPAAPIDPVVNFTFTETGPAEGTKGPDNPSTIAGVSSIKVTRCGKNLLQTNNLIQDPNVGLNITVNEDGTISISGSTPSNSGSYLYFFNPTQNTSFGLPKFLALGKTYTSSFSCNDANIQFAIYFHNGTSWSPPYSGNQTFTVPTNAISCIIRLLFPMGTTFNGTAKIQIEEGSTATAFEPYAGTDYTLALGDAYYGGSVDLSTGTLTVTWYGKVLTGTESWFDDNTHGTYYRYAIGSIPNVDSTASRYCTHYLYAGNYSYEEQHFLAQGTYLYFFTTQTTLEDWKSWLATQYANNAPVVVVYKLKTPQSVQLTPTQIYSLSQLNPYTPRLNTIYTDQQSVQVGYPKSPIYSAQELTNAIVSLGGNL